MKEEENKGEGVGGLLGSCCFKGFSVIEQHPASS